MHGSVSESRRGLGSSRTTLSSIFRFKVTRQGQGIRKSFCGLVKRYKKKRVEVTEDVRGVPKGVGGRGRGVHPSRRDRRYFKL